VLSTALPTPSPSAPGTLPISLPNLPVVGQLLPPARRELPSGHLPLGPSSPGIPAVPLAPARSGSKGSVSPVAQAGSTTPSYMTSTAVSPPATPGAETGVASFARSSIPRAQSLCCGGNSLGVMTQSVGRMRSLPSPIDLVSSMASAAAEITTVAAARRPGGNGARTPGGSAPTPLPVPAPAGSSSSAVGSAAGASSIIFLTLAGLLAWGAPQALRRLRLASESRRPAPFVLIPDRPG
jgi:hypothetical protein